MAPTPLRTLLLLMALALVPTAWAMKQQWDFDQEDRREFSVERFGFGPAGSLHVRVSDVVVTAVSNQSFSASTASSQHNVDLIAGVLFVHESDMLETMAALHGAMPGDEQQTQDEDDGASNPLCLVQERPQDVWIDLSDESTWEFRKNVTDENEPLLPGFYYVFVAHCSPEWKLSFHMEAEFKNGDANYLSAGDAELPTVYLMLFIAFLLATLSWIYCLYKNADHIHSVHHLMTLLVLVKTLTLFAESMRVYYMKIHGDALTSWTAVYYTLAVLKGLLLFGVLLLIGMGWSIVKPHLSTRDKYVLSTVLVLQVLSNTAMIALEESSVGTRSWVTWRDVLHLMDILCCLAILVPIVWSIRQLRQSAATDGKAHQNLQKLVQFRSFYLLVVTYIYVTRIALFLLLDALPYDATWVAVALGEVASLTFFVLTGWRFRPVPLNPYLELHTHVDALDEFDILDDDDDDDISLFDVPSKTLHREPRSSKDQFMHLRGKSSGNAAATAV